MTTREKDNNNEPVAIPRPSSGPATVSAIGGFRLGVPSVSTCAWALNDVGGASTWETACKRDFYFDGADGPTDAGFTTCPFCGKPLTEHLTSRDEPASSPAIGKSSDVSLPTGSATDPSSSSPPLREVTDEDSCALAHALPSGNDRISASAIERLRTTFDALLIAEVKQFGGIPSFAGRCGYETNALRDAIAELLAEATGDK